MVESTTASIPQSAFRQNSLSEGTQPSSPTPTSEVLDKAKIEEAKREPLSPRLLALAKREKALRARDLALKQREETLQTKEKEYQSPQYIAKNAFQEKLKASPLEALQELGMDYNAISETLLNQAANPTDYQLKKLQSKLEALEAKQAESLKAQETTQQEQIETTKKAWLNEAKLLADSSPEFELLKESGDYDSVVSLIWEYGEETGEVLSVKEAAAEIEEVLLERALKYAKAKKIQEKLAGEVSKEELPDPLKAEGTAPRPNTKSRISVRDQVDPEKPRINTLTQSHSTSSARSLSQKERMARAIAALSGQLPA